MSEYTVSIENNNTAQERHSGLSRITTAFIAFAIMLVCYLGFMQWELATQREYAKGIDFISEAQEQITEYSNLDSSLISSGHNAFFVNDIKELKAEEQSVNLKIINLQTTTQFLGIIKLISYTGLAVILWWLLSELSIIVISPVKFESSIVHRFNMPVIIAVAGLIILAIFFKGMPN